MARPNCTPSRRPLKKPTLTRNLYYRNGQDWIWVKFSFAGQAYDLTTKVHASQPGALKDAETFRDRVRANVAAGRSPLALGVGVEPTLREVADLFLERPGNRLDRTKVQRCDLLCAFFGANAKPSSITTAAVDRYVAGRLATVSRLGGTVTPNTIKRELNVLRGMIRFGAGERLYAPVEFNIPKLRVLAKDKKRTAGKLHHPDKVEALIAGCTPEIAALFRFARLTGARRDEMLRARRSELRFTGHPDVPAEITLKDTKNKTERTLQLNHEALAALQVGLDMGDTERVWPLSLKSVSSRVHKFNKQAGHTPGDYVTLRDMRHEVATRMYNDGTPIEVVMHQLGHKTRSITDNYIHHPTNALEAQLRAYWATRNTNDLVPGLKSVPRAGATVGTLAGTPQVYAGVVSAAP